MQIKINMPSDVVPIDLGAGDEPASANVAGAEYLSKQTISGYAGFASNVFLDIYYTKISADTWEVAVYDRAKATAGGFPYGSPGDPPLAQQSLTFDPISGALIGGGLVNVNLPGGDLWPIDFGGSVSIPDMSSGWEDSLQVAFNLPTTAAVIDPYVLGSTPADNLASSSYSEKTSVIAYDYSGRPVPLDIYYTKGTENVWEVTVFNKDHATNGGFPYSSGPLATTLLEFDPATSGLVEGKQLDIIIPNGEVVTLDLSGTKSVASPFSIITAGVNGSLPSFAEDFVISNDGLVSVRYSNGTLVPISQIGLANVPNPDGLVPINGNAFVLSNTTGGVTISSPNSGGMGSIVSAALEGSNVDIATELTAMVESQRIYSANSKVFQTGSELLDVLVNLKR
ncbi:flagellar hook-basal body complex protein [Agrobacterium sp.]|uniref:flagellar hook-basal body complex protein n=1 Tax=Agrobacterium sp. TaxID=361 RepID=UPI0028A6281E|nr:flagellar hook-basal body complex protein [Agrobacterium sp.]